MRWIYLGFIVVAAARLSAAQRAESPGIANVPSCTVVLAEEADLPPLEAGVIQEIVVRPGQPVEKDQLLIQLDDSKSQKEQAVAQAKYDAAKAKADDDINVRYAIAAAEVAKADYNTSKSANTNVGGAVTQIALLEKLLKCKETELAIEKATLDRTIAKQEALVAKAELEAAKLTVERHKIISPISGKAVVVEIRAHKGEAVQPGQAVIHVVKLDTLWVEGRVLAKDFARSELDGRPVTVDVTITRGEKKSLPGKIIFVKPLTTSSDTYTVRAEVANQEPNGTWLLSPGMQGEMNIQLGK
jgi:multidrug efflux pump subunit AcrA (membrane-fusion protein)